MNSALMNSAATIAAPHEPPTTSTDSDAPKLRHGGRAIAAWFGKDARWFHKQIERRAGKDSRLPVFKIGSTWVADERDLAAWLLLQRRKAGAALPPE
jgi:hypothetical protein